MEEESLRFWIIPMICIVVGAAFFSWSLDYRYNTSFPNAELERQEIEDMDCSEIAKNESKSHYWSTDNAELAKSKFLICNPPKQVESSGLSPYVEFCTPGGFAPVKKIDNSTHSFNHDICLWELK